MSSDIDWGRLFGRPVVTGPAPQHLETPAALLLDPAAELARLATLDLAALERHIGDLLDVLRHGEGAVEELELHEDGSTCVSSMIAVYLLSELANSVGRERITQLSTAPRQDLESLQGLARLVSRCLFPEGQL